MKYGTWNVSEYASNDVLALLKAGYTPLTARILCARGLTSPQLAAEYLAADTPLLSPFLMRDMKQAADRVRLAIARREHIAVFGDYDVDGITATCLLTDFLRSQGATVTSYIPARLEEGYGLNESAILQLYRRSVNLIVTVDCGITANDEALLCKKMGMDLVITDHHECKEELPVAAAVVDPHRKDATYPHKNLSGVGIAFKLASAICGRQDEMLERYADLVALGLVADVMPLKGETRTMVVRGLQALSDSKRPGIRALMKECGCLGQPVTSGTIGYMLAPRINAAGRMGQVELATDLFFSQDEVQAEALASALCRLNRERQRVEADIYREAVTMIPPEESPGAIVLAGEAWHQGVVGIVASRLSDEYACPAFLICMDGDKGKASSRSYGGFNLFSALTELSDLLESYGGHELAAGFTIARDKVELFRRSVSRLARNYAEAGGSQTALRVDCAVSPELLSIENIQGLSQLEPCGSGCPSPVLYLDRLLLEQLSEVGSGKHLRLSLRYGKRPNEVLSGIFFSTTAKLAAVCVGDYVDVAFVPQINEYRGIRSVQLNLVDVRPCREDRHAAAESFALYNRFAEQTSLSPAQADALLPNRSEFVAVWRYLSANAADGGLQEEFSCLYRRIARAVGLPISMERVRICLDVFHEQGLIRLAKQRGSLCILLTSDGRKVDLDTSEIIKTLKRIRAGK